LAQATELRRAKRPIQVLLEGGFEGGRTGSRTTAEAMAVARAVAEAHPWLSLRGIEGYEGIISRQHPDDTTERIKSFLDFLIDLALKCERENLFAPETILLSAGGSSFYDLVVERFTQAGLHQDFLVLTRSGCYLTHDVGSYAQSFQQLLSRSHNAASLGTGLQAALEVWAYVQSRPEPSLVILTMGKRDCSYDSGMPVPLKWYRPAQPGKPQELGSEYVVTALNDQHAYLKIPHDSALRVGDMVACGISHPCTTFDKWRVLMVVNDDYDVLSAYPTFF
jgi:D-serine dehydratase